jgi:hypothetical protein
MTIIQLRSRHLDNSGDGIAALTVEVYATDAQGLPTGAAVASTTTDAAGVWKFLTASGLLHSTRYCVKITNGTETQWLDGSDMIQAEELAVRTTLTLPDGSTITSTGLNSPTLVTPTIASFAEANHNHQDGAGGAKLDHGAALDGLTDDDHTQYYNQARGDARYAPVAKGVTNGDSHDHTGGDGAAIVEAAITLADNTTNNVSTTKHGFVPKAPNDTAKFLRGDATWAAPSGELWLPADGPAVSGTTPNGTETAFHIAGNASAGVASSKVRVYVNGLLRRPTTDYTFSAGGSTVTFIWAPQEGDDVRMDYVAV